LVGSPTVHWYAVICLKRVINVEQRFLSKETTQWHEPSSPAGQQTSELVGQMMTGLKNAQKGQWFYTNASQNGGYFQWIFQAERTPGI